MATEVVTPVQDGPLQGLRVLELGTLIAGPFAGRLLADMGADVVKIEAPDRADPLRDWGQASGGHQFFWTVHARNKRCITLDLRTDRGRQVFLDLVRVSDVVVESFRPGTLERWGIGYDVLGRVNPALVLARVSGYGQTGPLASRPGYASVAEAMSGLRHLNGYPGQAPPRIALSLGDSLAGMFAFQGIQSALLARQRTGRGQVVDVALTEASLAVLESTVPDYDRTGHIRQASGTRLDRVSPSNIYRSRDGLWVLIAANQDTLFGRLCTVMGRPELATDERFVGHVERGEHQDELDELIADWAVLHDAEELIAMCNDAGVVAGRVNTVAEVVREPQFIARGMFVDHHDEREEHPVKGVDVVPKLSETPGRVRWAGPRSPGSHNQEVYAGLLGLSAEEIAALTSEGVV